MTTPNIHNGFRSTMDAEADKFDNLTRSVATIEATHRVVHLGFMYGARVHSASLGNGASLDMLFEVPADVYPHFQALNIGADGGPDTVQLFEGVTASANGTVVASYNLNRNSTNTSSVTVRENPTISDTGTLLDETYIYSAGNKQGVYNDIEGSELIFKPSTKYLIRYTNNSGSAEDIFMRAHWYELDWQNAENM